MYLNDLRGNRGIMPTRVCAAGLRVCGLRPV